MAGDEIVSRRPRAVTIKHVAAEAGVSLQTVSRVINDGPNVRDAIKQRVVAAIEKLGYVPSLAARRMGGTRSYLLLALNDRDRTIAGWQSGDGTDWVDQMLLGGMLKCAEHGYRMIFELVDTHSLHVERELTAALAALHPDGVILTPPHGDNPLITRLLASRHIPFARIGSDGQAPGFAIQMDDAKAAAAATEHLLLLGHRRIGFITGSRDYSLSVKRLVGYRSAMRGAGINTRDLVAEGDFTFESGVKGSEALLGLGEPVTAILASSDQMALAALNVARARGLEVPRDLSVVSFDDTPIVRFCAPPLTAIRQPIAPMTATAAELLIRAANGDEIEDGPHVLPFELIVRESTAAPPR
ncbi:LacI family DNA-binding transcriptional regulator [Sphingomonas parva]|uniref:LacI family DNA-binding transcriptional regulator n=1 Tax=Sphingomonas parva TaxID=2555898 RepID=A0A4Y8ZX01_9SPHN|nr:LacI family DNA-binding transcriptional regulator [Sphingomonas parva]TFI59725.1 LacI family DNA-binding transcriptional regulator [Sphingomonas parva]